MAVVQLLLGARRTCQQSACVSPCGVGAAAAFPRPVISSANLRRAAIAPAGSARLVAISAPPCVTASPVDVSFAQGAIAAPDAAV